MNKEKLGLIINAIFAGLIVASDIFYMLTDYSPYILKTITSAIFVLCGLFNLIYCLKVLNKKDNFWFMCAMFAGLVFAFLGDVLLIDNFVLGALFFGVGHIFFFLSFCLLTGFNIRDILIGAAIFVCAFLLITLNKSFEFGGMKVLVLVYALIISLMLGKAISNLFLQNNKWINIVIAVGAGLFFISDLMLLFCVFGSGALVFDILCLATYYPGEILLAFSIFAVGVYFKDISIKLKKK